MKTRLLIFSLLMVTVACQRLNPTNEEILPSWNEGPVKSAIIDYVHKVTDKKSGSYINPSQRIAAFDNDGTLWSEVPTAEVEFTKTRIKNIIAKNPALQNQEPYKSLLKRSNTANPPALTPKQMLDIMSRTHSGMSEEQFSEEVKNFLAGARHPKYGVPYQDLAYQPMTELVSYLQDNGFKVFISSGGDIGFMRAFASKIYGISPENVIGSFFVDKTVEEKGKLVLKRTSQLGLINDGPGKPVGLDRHIGLRPVFVAGNVRSGGDIEQLRYSSEGKLPSLQILINHDDADREVAYSEKDGKSLKAAEKFKWHVVSMKKDWRQIFSPAVPEPVNTKISQSSEPESMKP